MLADKEKSKSDTISKHMHSDPNIYNLDINDELELLPGGRGEDANQIENEVASAAEIDHPHGSLSGMQIYNDEEADPIIASVPAPAAEEAEEEDRGQEIDLDKHAQLNQKSEETEKREVSEDYVMS